MEKLDITQIKTGDCLLVSGKRWLARTIQWFEKNKYNHAGMFYWCYGKLFVIEAEKQGVVMTPIEDYLKVKANILICKPSFHVDGSEYGAFMLPFLGKTRYGFVNLLFFQPIKFLTGWWIGRGKQDKKNFICGEWCAFVYNHFQPSEFPQWEKVAPSDIFNDVHFEHFEYNYTK